MKRSLSCLLAGVVTLGVAGCASAAPNPLPGDEPDKVAAYFRQQALRSQMGSIILTPALGRDPATLAALIAHQDEFTPGQARAIILDENLADKSAFLPLLRREVAAPNYDPDALAVLSEISPAECRPLIIADLQQAQPRFRRQKTYRYPYPDFDLHLPDKPIPELTAFFRRELRRSPQPELDGLLRLVERYGTPDLLPDVLNIYRPHAGAWECVIEVACLRYWIRCDHAAGMAALEASRRSRTTGCYRGLLAEVSEGRWDADMHHLALKDLSGGDPELAAGSILVLERSGEADDAGAVVNAYTRLVYEAAIDPAMAKVFAEFWTDSSSGARTLLENKRLRCSDEQARELKVIASAHP